MGWKLQVEKLLQIVFSHGAWVPGSDLWQPLCSSGPFLLGRLAVGQASGIGNPTGRSLPGLKTWLIFKGFRVFGFF